MIRIFASPDRYIQGVGAFDLIAETLASLASRPFIVVDADILPLVRPRLEAQFAGKDAVIAAFSGEVTVAVIERLAEQARAAGCDIVVGVGGGKALDTAKGVTCRIGTRFVSVPTIASNDSPTARPLAVYDDEHRLVALEKLDQSPAAVVVDTALIAAAPVHFLLSGIGDAIAKKFEAEEAWRLGSMNFHGTPALHTAIVIANGCYETLRSYGVAGVAAAKRHEVNDALEAVIEANLLMSGLGWESGGLSVAHGVVRGISQARITNGLHGMHVACGLLVQLAYENRSDSFIADFVHFYREIGLPTSLADLGMVNATDCELRQIADRSLIGPKGGMIIMPENADDLYRALVRIQQFDAN